MHQDFSGFDNEDMRSEQKPLKLTGTLGELLEKIQDAISQGYSPDAIYSINSDTHNSEDEDTDTSDMDPGEYGEEGDYNRFLEDREYDPESGRDLWEEMMSMPDSHIETDLSTGENENRWSQKSNKSILQNTQKSDKPIPF